MKNRVLIIALVFITLMTTGAWSEVYYWRLAEEEVEGSVCDLYAREFARLLHERSGGKINLTVFPLGTIGTPQEIYKLCQQGALEFILDGAGQVGEFVPENQVFSIPFLFPDDQHQNERILATSTALNDTLNSVYEKGGVTVLSYWSEGAMDWTSNRPLLYPQDFTGLKMRTMPSRIIAEAYRLLGANPKVIPFTEVYSSLQLGIVEAQENAPYIVREMGFMDSQKYYIRSQHKIYVMQTMANLGFWRSLPDDVRKMVSDVVQELRPFAMRTQMELNQKRLMEIRSSLPKGHSYLELTRQQRQAFAETIDGRIDGIYIKNSNDKEKALKILMGLRGEIQRSLLLP